TFHDYYLQEGDNYNKQVQLLKEDIRKILVSHIDDNNFSSRLNFIDAIQRLGVFYHFEHELDGALHQIYDISTKDNHIVTHDDLYHVALLFRLLRQQGYRISSDIFYKFKDQSGNFNERLANDLQGMLSLYEATQLRCHGEEVLEEAHNFTLIHLTKSTTNQLSHSLAKQPQYSISRRITTKVIALCSIIDDMYDAYGTIDELELFTNAIERWDICCLVDLPEYMKLCYSTILDVFEEMEQEMRKQEKLYCIKYAKKEMKRVVRAHMTEATWCHYNQTPTIEEYMQVRTISSCYPMLIIVSFVGMEDTTEEVLIWATSDPIIVAASTIICRLIDDIVGNEFEQERTHVVSSIECYMKQHKTSRQYAIEELCKMVENAWKDINEACLIPTQVPMTFLIRVINFTRVIDVLYKDEDNYTNAGGILKDHIEALLVNKMSISIS
ncbi:(-)-germacrene D synthase, partial [Mucuna pruriens]